MSTRDWAVLFLVGVSLAGVAGVAGYFELKTHRMSVLGHGGRGADRWMASGVAVALVLLVALARWFRGAVAEGDRYRTPSWLRLVAGAGGVGLLFASVMQSDDAWTLLPLTVVFTLCVGFALLVFPATRYYVRNKQIE